MLHLPVPLSLTLPFPAMGCAASTVRAERRRRGLALGHEEASTTTGPVAALQHNVPQDSVSVAAADGRRRRSKVAPEPKEVEEPAPAMPGSPSFRFYCQKAATVDALVSAADADGGDSDGAVRVTETPQAIKKNDLANSSSKEVSGRLKFRGLAIVSAVYSLFNRHSSAASAPAAAAKSHHPSAASPPAAAAVAISCP